MEQNITQLYKDKLMEDFNLANLPEEQQEKAMQMLSERFQRVIIYTLLRALTDEQKKQFAAALANPDDIEDNIADIASEVPGLGQQIEDALTHEYEILKFAMNK